MKKVDVARQTFESLKSQGLKATKSHVAKLAGVSRSLLTPRGNGAYKSKEWGQLANDIDVYLGTDKPSKINDRYRNKMEEARYARDESERKYRAQVEQTAGFCAELVEIRRELQIFKSAHEKIVNEKDKLQSLYSSLSAHYMQPVITGQGNVAPIAASITISPDEELLNITGGQYKWDNLIARQVHIYTQKKLRAALARIVPKRLYLLIGRPGAGKSSWIKSYSVFNDGRLAIYYDATNATVADRWEIMEFARESDDTVVCYIYFDIDVRICLANNLKRKDIMIPEDVIRNYKVDPPELSEGFDELIVVREITYKVI